jgi:leucyl/phenylalanyl-tRNA--protein transferase
MLLSAYSQGVFPWFSENDPILWWCPDPRFVVFLDEVHRSRSMKRLLRRRTFRITIDADFHTVIRRCAEVPRPGQSGTWITDDMLDAYQRLHNMGYAHSCEVWCGTVLVGGLYGVGLGRMFFGESMFSLQPNASKTAFLVFATFLRIHQFTLMDSQVFTPHVSSLGGREISRDEFLALVAVHTRRPPLANWSEQFEEDSVVEAAISDELP